ncbi:precorrin-6A/cobalt-precorrin-6A reductase [uncultured Jannaschia sp.]|uniref:precorrin-6A/cobalt-precorrin-6A reductase n=1 Tax=uncultured Jannaschia sp. TaxID=293347 RepID=UPI0026115EBE|nr:precorrin-6A/cobalt-precorrin-6A reductase [uncultured Jannaschia sp.]
MRSRVLILAGTAEARRLCAAVADRDVEASLAGATADPAPLGVPTRRGGFGGEPAFRAALADVAAVLDATHPFACAMTARAVRVCVGMGRPYLRLIRPPWPVRPGCLPARSATDVAARLSPDARVFLATGPGSLDAFAGRGLAVFCRRIDPAPERDGVTWIVGRPPFDLAYETALFRDLGITDLVTKNAGGATAKLDAAAALGLAVHVIERPPSAGGEESHDIRRAIAFVRSHAGPRP